MQTKFYFPVFILLIGLFSCSPEGRQPKITFQPLQTGVDIEIRGLHVINQHVIWAAGSQGTVLLSVDGGEHWKISRIKDEENNEFRSLHGWDAKRAMVVGIQNPARFYMTVDGGESWGIIYVPNDEGLFFNSMKFADYQHGLALSDPIDDRFYLLKTDDGGLNWKRIENMPPIVQGEANFAASNTCIEYLPSGEAWFVTGGQVARVFRSIDYGETWRVSDVPFIDGNSNSGIYSVAFTDAEHGVMTGGTWNNPEANKDVAAWTSDGGLTWHASVSMPGAFRSCVQSFVMDGQSVLIAIGKTGCDYSLDQGQNWTPVQCEGYYTFRSVPDQMMGFAAGSKGRMAKITID